MVMSCEEPLETGLFRVSANEQNIYTRFYHCGKEQLYSY